MVYTFNSVFEGTGNEFDAENRLSADINKLTAKLKELIDKGCRIHMVTQKDLGSTDKRKTTGGLCKYIWTTKYQISCWEPEEEKTNDSEMLMQHLDECAANMRTDIQFMGISLNKVEIPKQYWLMLIALLYQSLEYQREAHQRTLSAWRMFRKART